MGHPPLRTAKKARERYYSDNGMGQMPSLVTPLVMILLTFFGMTINLFALIVNSLEADPLAFLNFISFTLCGWSFNQMRDWYSKQIERRAEWRKKKYESWLAKIPREIPEEDWEGIERVIEAHVKDGYDGLTLSDAKHILRREKEREERMQPCAHRNTETFLCDATKSELVCSDCGHTLRRGNPFGRRD